jgi:membrane-associated phospholipid phosphatase
MYIYFLLFSIIPFIDKFVTKYFYNINILKQLSNSYFIKKLIMYINGLFYLYFFIFYKDYKTIILHALFDLFFISTILKGLLDRPRPKDSIFLDNKYYSLMDITLTKNPYKNQSFVSSHVSFTYSIYYLLCKYNSILSYFYLINLIIIFLCRINKGSHYFSDCCFAIVFCNLFYLLI